MRSSSISRWIARESFSAFALSLPEIVKLRPLFMATDAGGRIRRAAPELAGVLDRARARGVSLTEYLGALYMFCLMRIRELRAQGGERVGRKAAPRSRPPRAGRFHRTPGDDTPRSRVAEAVRIASAVFTDRIRATPAPVFTTFFTEHPKLISRMLAPDASTIDDASATSRCVTILQRRSP